MEPRFEVVDGGPGDLAGITVVDHGREDLTVAVNVIDVSHAEIIAAALETGCPA